MSHIPISSYQAAKDFYLNAERNKAITSNYCQNLMYQIDAVNKELDDLSKKRACGSERYRYLDGDALPNLKIRLEDARNLLIEHIQYCEYLSLKLTIARCLESDSCGVIHAPTGLPWFIAVGKAITNGDEYIDSECSTLPFEL